MHVIMEALESIYSLYGMVWSYVFILKEGTNQHLIIFLIRGEFELIFSILYLVLVLEVNYTGKMASITAISMVRDHMAC